MDHFNEIHRRIAGALRYALHAEAASGRFEAAGFDQVTMNAFLDHLYGSLAVPLRLHFHPSVLETE